MSRVKKKGSGSAATRKPSNKKSSTRRSSKGGGRPKFSLDQVETALRAGGGVVAQAALKLGCTRQTVHNYIKANDEKLGPVLEDIRGARLDVALTHHLKGLKKGDLRCVEREMNSVGAGEQGYGRHAVKVIKVVGGDGGPIQIQHSFVDEIISRVTGIKKRMGDKKVLQESDAR